MVNFVAAIDFCYGECCIAFSTRVLQSENERSIGMLAFIIFCSSGATCNGED